ncbi:MAG: translation initiation factor IF-2 [Verrucomicrobia bacterium]|nr:translation initiation factor IF-2 [Verrucomicrobiota bacterium]
MSRIKPIVAAKPTPKPAPATPQPPPAAPKPVVVDLISSSSPRAVARETAAPTAADAPTPAAASSAPVAESASAPAETAEPGAEKIIHLKPPVLVKDLAAAMGLKTFQINKDLIQMNVFANQATILEPAQVAELCKKHGFVFEAEKREKGGGVHKVEAVVAPPPKPVIEKVEELQPRAPIVTVMGHVDHGKTSLLDAIRKTRVAAGEAGGITQHIGAYRVNVDGKPITFLDTPGHAAFTQMRARGANVTDIVVLVVAADDGLMPQTREAIAHAKAAKATIMVAINKIDLPGANLDRVKTQLQEAGLQPDDWGGDTTCVPVSATKGTGVKELLDLLTTQAELLDLKASATAPPRGIVIEAQLEAGRGPTATVIVQMGTLENGDAFICGNYSGKVKAMFDDLGKPVKSAGPSVPVKVLGFSGLPNAGDELLVMESERDAKALGEERQAADRHQKLVAPARLTLEDLFRGGGTEKKTLRLVLKADVQGSLEAIVGSLRDIKSNKVEVDFIHTGVGPVSDSDVLLATASNAVIIGFNTKVESAAVASAKREGVQIKLYSIIYELIDQVKEAMAGLLDPELREAVIGHAEVKKVFETSKGSVAGCIVTDGRVARTARARVKRGKQAVYDGGLATLRRFQDDVKEVRAGTECGIKLGDFSEYQEGDVIECYTLEKVPQKL